ncbi:MAG: DivIVA domain-containing protein [Cellulomonas sp.]
MLTSADVLNQKFAATKFREGYDQDEVDDFLDRVVETLKEREGVGHAANPVTAADLEAVRFQATKWREGYDQQEVDGFLDRVRQQLRDPAPLAEAAPTWSPVPTDAPGGPLFPPSSIGVPSAAAVPGSVLVMRLQTMRASRPTGAPDTVTVRLPDGTLRPVTDLRSTVDGIELVLG